MPFRHEDVSSETVARPVTRVAGVRHREDPGLLRQGGTCHADVQAIQARAELTPVGVAIRRQDAVPKSAPARDSTGAVIASAGGAQVGAVPAASTGVARHAQPHDEARTRDRRDASVAMERDALSRSPAAAPIDAMASGHEDGEARHGAVSRGEGLARLRTQKRRTAGVMGAWDPASFASRQAVSQEAVVAQASRPHMADALGERRSVADESALQPQWPSLPGETAETEDRPGGWPGLPVAIRGHEEHDGSGWLQRHQDRLRREQEGAAWKG